MLPSGALQQYWKSACQYILRNLSGVHATSINKNIYVIHRTVITALCHLAEVPVFSYNTCALHHV